MRFPVELPGQDGRAITVTAFTPDDAPGLFAAIDDAAVWTHIPVVCPRTSDELAARLTGTDTQQPLVVRESDKIVGTSSFHFDPSDSAGVEVGSTLLTPAVWGTGVNTAAKRLMLAAAFAAGADWVQLRTDERNLRSAAAILKLLGVVELAPRPEPQWVRPDGTVRTSRMFQVPRPA